MAEGEKQKGAKGGTRKETGYGRDGEGDGVLRDTPRVHRDSGRRGSVAGDSREEMAAGQAAVKAVMRPRTIVS